MAFPQHNSLKKLEIKVIIFLIIFSCFGQRRHPILSTHVMLWLSQWMQKLGSNRFFSVIMIRCVRKSAEICRGLRYFHYRNLWMMCTEVITMISAKISISYHFVLNGKVLEIALLISIVPRKHWRQYFQNNAIKSFPYQDLMTPQWSS